MWLLKDCVSTSCRNVSVALSLRRFHWMESRTRLQLVLIYLVMLCWTLEKQSIPGEMYMAVFEWIKFVQRLLFSFCESLALRLSLLVWTRGNAMKPFYQQSCSNQLFLKAPIPSIRCPCCLRPLKCKRFPGSGGFPNLTSKSGWKGRILSCIILLCCTQWRS